MPYFKWTGVNSIGQTKKGKQAAYSLQDLSEQLLSKGVALLYGKPIYVGSLFWPISAKIKGDLFKQKAKLLRAGLLLPDVLTIVAQQSYNPIVYDMLFTISRDIQHGASFTKALEKHHKLCDPIVMVMLTAGNESGNIMNAVESVALYFHKQYIFNKNVRSALAMPVLTLLFFIGISLFIFVFIIPRFADMFSSLQQELPPLTRFMIQLSDFVCSFSIIYLLGVLAALVFAVHYYVKNVGKKIWDTAVNKLPFIGVVILQYHLSQALQALALLINSGVTLATSLKIVNESIDHSLVKEQFALLYEDVTSGLLLSKAMSTSSLFLSEVIALVHIGEETGSLGQSLESAAIVYYELLENRLRKFVFFLQPVMIICLGLLVTTLIFAVYLPIMQLSYVI